jgi:hypothetical protein
MFVGHYGPAFAARAAGKSISLWVAFIAVQFVDVLWAIFVLLGVEKVRIVPRFTATNPLDLYYMPYTHSLIGAAAWAISACIIYYSYRKVEGWSAAVLVGAAVFSHWFLDWIVHRPDLPLYDNSFKVGLGLWNYPAFAFLLELAILFGGMYLYFKTTESVSHTGRYGMAIFGVLMMVVQFIVFFGPAPSSDKAAAVTALVLYFVFAASAYWLDKQRIARSRISSRR